MAYPGLQWASHPLNLATQPEGLGRSALGTLPFASDAKNDVLPVVVLSAEAAPAHSSQASRIDEPPVPY